ncbi:MAG: hypothetical protein ACT4P6_08260 [Gemmatimonadaceae bacterium]
MTGVLARAKTYFVLASVIGCSSPAQVGDADDDLTPGVARALHITPVKGSWTWDEVAGPQGSGVRATLTNATARSFISTLADKFNSATEQANLYVAKGGTSALEWRDPSGDWVPSALVQLVEGVKPVLLRRGGHYTLTALVFGPRRTGLYRVRVDYVASANEGESHTDYSPPFEIR